MKAFWNWKLQLDRNYRELIFYTQIGVDDTRQWSNGILLAYSEGSLVKRLANFVEDPH